MAKARVPPDWAEGLELEGIRAFGQRWNVRVADGEVLVQKSGE